MLRVRQAELKAVYYELEAFFSWRMGCLDLATCPIKGKCIPVTERYSFRERSMLTLNDAAILNADWRDGAGTETASHARSTRFMLCYDVMRLFPTLYSSSPSFSSFHKQFIYLINRPSSI